MRIFVRLLNLLAIVFFFSACGGGNTVSLSQADDSVTFRHAKLIHVYNHENYRIATISNPWKAEQILHTYILIPKKDTLPDNIPEGTVLRTPLNKTILFSAVHCGLLYSLNKIDAIAGVCDLTYIQQQQVREEFLKGNILNMGNAMSPNVEKILTIHPDGLLVSPFENSGGYGMLDKTSLPLIECADYMEHSPLGRAEWMRFYGILYGCEETADSLFNIVEKRYSKLAKLASGTKERPSVFCDLKEGATWYIPGAKSVIGQLYNDAGAKYLFSDYKQNGSVSLSFETVYQRAHDADIWFVKYGQSKDITYQQMRQDYEPYTGFKAWKERRIYGCNTFHVPFYEEEPFRPDYFLEDLVKICHPELLPSHSLRYYTPMQ